MNRDVLLLDKKVLIRELGGIFTSYLSNVKKCNAVLTS
jgi:hypothetical protein